MFPCMDYSQGKEFQSYGTREGKLVLHIDVSQDFRDYDSVIEARAENHQSAKPV